MTLIKVCRVEDIHTARLCGDLHVDMIGLHGIHRVSLHRQHVFTRICSELREYYPHTVPVLVTKLTDPGKIALLLSTTGVEWIQVHAPMDRSQTRALLDGVTARLGRRPGHIATVAADDPEAATLALDLRDLADYVLVDTSYRGGTGRQADATVVRKLIESIHPTPCLVAGGLTVNNLPQVMADLAPDGLDVQSGLESDLPGRPKDPMRLARFVAMAKGTSGVTMYDFAVAGRHRPIVSVAVTTTPLVQLDKVLKRFRLTDVDVVHVDFSDGSMAPSFIAEPLQAVERLSRLAPCIPYDVHLFITSREKQGAILKECLGLNPLLRVALVHCTCYDYLAALDLKGFCALTNVLGVGSGLALQATGFTEDEVLSALDSLESLPLAEVSLITRSRSHSLREVAREDVRLLRVMSNWRYTASRRTVLSVDRDMTLEKLAALSAGRPQHVVVGTALLASRRPQRSIAAFRRLLSSPNSTVPV